MDQSKKINILMTTSTLPRWKNDYVLKIVLEIAKNINKNYPNTKIFILAPHYPNSKLNETLEGINIIRFKYFFEKHEKLCYNSGMLSNIEKNKLYFFLIPFFCISQILTIRKIVKREKISIIHSNWLIPQGFISVLYKLIFNRKIKTICTIHGGDIYGLKNIILKLLKKIVIRYTDKITTVSNALKNEIIKLRVSNKKIFLIENSADSKFFFPQNKKDIKLIHDYNIKSFCLLYVGRIVEQKGVQYLIDAMPEIIKSYSQIKLLIVGEGIFKNQLISRTHSLKLQNHIKFIGKIDNNSLPQYYNLADILICPSTVGLNNDTEGLPVVLCEALACGIPVIATNVGGNSDIIINNKTGLLIEQRNTKDIIHGVLLLLKNKRLREKLSLNEVKLFNKTLNWKKVSSKYYRLYLSLI